MEARIGRTMGLGEGRAVMDAKTGEFGNQVRTILMETARGLGDEFPTREVSLNGKLVRKYRAFTLLSSPGVFGAYLWVPDERVMIRTNHHMFSTTLVLPEVGESARLATLKEIAKYGPNAIPMLDAFRERQMPRRQPLQRG